MNRQRLYWYCPTRWVKIARGMPPHLRRSASSYAGGMLGAHRAAWRSRTIRAALQAAIDDESSHADSNAGG